MKKLNKKYAHLLHLASIATGRKEAVDLLHKAAKLQTKFDEKSNFEMSLLILSILKSNKLLLYFWTNIFA